MRSLGVLGILCWCVLSSLAAGQGAIQEGLKLSNIRMHDPWMVADDSTKTYYMYEGGSPARQASGAAA